MEGVERYEVRLLPHNNDWINEFEALKPVLATILGDNVLDIQHVGSTSIKNINAKPILDVAIKVISFSGLNIEGMKHHGYDYCGESGVSGRQLFVLRKDGHVSLHHIHCYEADNIGFENQVCFRNHLNTHPNLAQQYNDLKHELAMKYPNDRYKYTDGKESFIQFVLKLANGQ